MAEITYTRQGDYNLPNLLPPQEEPVPHGKYALLRGGSSRSNAGSPTRTC